MPPSLPPIIFSHFSFKPTIQSQMANDLVLDSLVLDLGDYAPPEGLVPYFRDETSYSAAAPSLGFSDTQQPVKLNAASLFLSFLATAQTRGVDFLPVTWDDSMRGVGAGGQASISQSNVNSKLSYVYKRIRQQDLKTPADNSRAMQALTAEVTVLGHSMIRGHPNIVRLTGICWDIPSNEQERIWPVLVFEKAENKDLKQFMESDTGRKLDTKQRLELCQDIAAAITLMHSIICLSALLEIIHGDIKPHNILVFNDTNGGLVAKVTDFGFATLQVTASTDGRIELPISNPWNAPEVCLEEDYSLHQARLTDIYSFGLLCLWLLFADSPQILDRISTAKSEGQLLPFAHSQVQTLTGLNQDDKRSLCGFFNATISHDPNDRSLDLQKCMEGFAAFVVPPLDNDGFSMYEMYMPYLSVLPHHREFNVSRAQAKHFEQTQLSWSDFYNPYANGYAFARDKELIFELPKSFRQLMHCDYRLWNYIFHLFEDLYEECDLLSDDIRRSTTYQLAFCHYIGFGTPLDENKAQVLLEDCGLPMQAVESDVEGIKTDLNPMRYNNLETEIVLAAYEAHYRKQGILGDAQAVYHAVSSNMDTRLGETHSTSIALSQAFGMIQMANGEYRASYETLGKVVRRCEQSFGPKHAVTISAITTQSQAAKLAGIYDEESQLSRKLLDAKRTRPKPEENRSTIAGLLELADRYCTQYRGWEQREAERQALEMMISHIQEAVIDDTTKQMGTQILDLVSQKKYHEACELGEKIFEEVSHCLDEGKPTYLVAMDLLHTLFDKDQDYKRCEKITRRSLQLRQSYLGPEHEDTLRNMANLAYSMIYQRDSRYWQSLNLLADALELGVKFLGHGNGFTLRTMVNLAANLDLCTRDEETNELYQTARRRARELDPEYWKFQPDPA
ncbi:serine threonine kinase [Fusarium tjaetaba]|uniref:Serine threonine kinase n=1 Tax=Fusarium tjaetaba TaxID=1567544 RepID=A0A8H5QAW5_9HYPO|nr:serine threonine kinase [Fusarium tjaetaba]KAF5610581.1 serine threonine kinase [Fusarium tjaetaba]